MSGVAEVQHAADALRTALANCTARSVPDHLAVLDLVETLTCQLPAVRHRELAALQTETTPREMGAKTWKDFTATRWRLSPAEAGRRLTDASLLGPRHALTGETLEPVLPATAAAQALGAITAEHVTEIRTAMGKLPGFVDAVSRSAFEVDLVRTAAGASPKDVENHAHDVLFLMDQDGPEPTDEERQKTRGVTRGRQRPNGNVPVTADFTPDAWATYEPLLAKYAAPGMCNPADEFPCTSGTPSQEQIDGDHRSLAQRQHDAMIVIGRIALMSGQAGTLNGLPVQIIIRTTLQDLESRAGVGVTGGGTRMPIRDVIRLAAHAHHSLAVFDGVTGRALDLFRTKRTANVDQRLVLIARDGGCTKPGCTVGAYGTQVHHAAADWHHGGQTNVDELGLACGGDNRLVDQNGGWTTRLNHHHEVEWIPPPHLDTGQTRINTYHTPERHLHPPEDPEPPSDTTIRAGHTGPDGTGRPETDPLTPRAGDPSEPGGPEPPERDCG